jgi:hypothetical protein
LTKTHAQPPLNLATGRPATRKGLVRVSTLLRAAALASIALAWAHASDAHAQTPPEADTSGAVAPAADTATSEPSAQQRQAAAEAYDRGTAAFLSRDFVAAARWFETAHRMAPAAPALLQAVRANERAGNTLRAANLALRLQMQYGSERQAARVAEPIVTSADRAFVRVDVTCEGCTVDLDGTLQEWTSFYLEPGTDHAVGAHFETGDAATQQVNAVAGSQQALRFVAPPPPPEPVVVPDTTRRDLEAREAADAEAREAERRRRAAAAESSGLSPVIFIVSAAATVAAGGVLVWSGLDTLAGVAPYEAHATQAGLEAGQAKELRTNILIAATSVLGATTLIFALLTNWGGRGEEAPAAATVQAAIAPVAGGAVGMLGGTF